MVDFDENDLVFEDYVNTTTKEDDPDYIGIQDRIRVNKKELYEVVWFCDAYVKNNDVPKTKSSFRKVEKLIRLDEASDIVLRTELNKFVLNNWNSSKV